MTGCAKATHQVLLVDDDRTIQRLTEAFLKPLDVDCEFAGCGAEAFESLARRLPDLILLDHEMPGESGLEILERLKADPILAQIPVIYATGTEKETVISRCFEAGANDYIQKPIRRPELVARVQSVLERQRMMRELWTNARTDSLTGLPNRLLLQETLGRAIERAHHDPNYHFAVLFLDFDRFKMINDSLGHEIGDMLLQQIASRLRRNLRSEDAIVRDSQMTTLSRLGGDEFVILLGDIPDEDAAAAVATRLLNVLNRPYSLAGNTVNSTASIGVVCSDRVYRTADEMLRDADIAMYEAKARGKACHVVFDPCMHAAVVERHRIESDLRHAVGTDQIHLMYQPIFSIEDGGVIGMEALARWAHPELGPIPPDRFIPVAEETGLIIPLGEQVLHAACRQFQQWRRQHAGLKYVSVNVSPAQLEIGGFATLVRDIVIQHGMTPDELQLEVTESMIMSRPETAVTLLQELKALGIRLAMDDFGTGYSSLSCLHRFPFDVIKIDRSFVQELNGERSEFVALVHAIVNLAYNLGMECVAEGIETHEQVAVLLAVDCLYGQGYLLGRPAAADGVFPPSWYNAAPAVASQLSA
ncbi:MAG: EAL domain-containing response regulator [Gammaproteobacteria bacterium]|nr:MAG: EAL domain-containing response regulator [Gammaproteobacteria bacterium]